MPNEEINESTSKKCIIWWTKDFKDKCLGTIHKIKSVIWQYCHEPKHILNAFKYFIFCNKVFLLVFHISLHLFKWMFFIFHDFIFYRRIALWLISYTMKMFAAKMLRARKSMAKMLMVKISCRYFVPGTCRNCPPHSAFLLTGCM